MAFGLRRRGNQVSTGGVSTQAISSLSPEKDDGDGRRGQRRRRRRKNRRGNRKECRTVRRLERRERREDRGDRRIRRRSNRSILPRANRRVTRRVQRRNRRFERRGTIPTPVTVATTRPITRTATIRVIEQPIQPFPKRPASKYSKDSLNLAETQVNNNQFEPVERNGISVFRPEILTITDFKPVFQGDMRERIFTPVGNLIDLQDQSTYLRRDTLVENMTSLDEWQNEEAQDAFADIQASFKQELDRTRRTLEHFSRYADVIESSKDRVDLRQIPQNAFDSPNFLSLRDFMEAKMQFSKLRQQYFSDSKTYLQLCTDFKAVLENYSFDLLNLVDDDRQADVSPIDIDNTYTLKDGFSFSIEAIRSENDSENASSAALFNSTLNSLPPDPEDRIKLLLTVLSKEYRVSKHLTDSDISSILAQRFGQGNSGTPFDNIVGIPGDTIFDAILGNQSLSSLGAIGLNDNSVVLPFERKYVDSGNSGKTFVPGASFFFDSILNVQGQQFNTQPFVDYTNSFSSITNDAKKIITQLFELDDTTTRLTPEVMSDSIMSSFNSAISGLKNRSSIDKDQAAIIALFRLANTDNKLKIQLFQFLLLLGISSQTALDVKSVFRQLGGEIEDTRNLSQVRLISGESTPLATVQTKNTISPYLRLLAQDIETRVFDLTRNTATLGRGFSLIDGISTTEELRSQAINAIDRFASVTAQDISGIRALDYKVGSIETLLMSNWTPTRLGSSNLVKEFLDLANEFTRAASRDGNATYLLDDASGRTRYNFISTSMQLLLLFELLSSFADRYGFANYVRGNTDSTIVALDIRRTDYVSDIIDELVQAPPPRNRPPGPAVVIPAYERRNLGTSTLSLRSSARPYSPTFSSFMSQNNARLSNSNVSSKIESFDRVISSIFRVFGDSSREQENERILNQNLDNSALGRSTVQHFNRVADTILRFDLESIQMRRSMFSIREKVGNEDKAISNFIHIFDVINRTFTDTKTTILSTFNSQTLTTFLSENTLEDLDIVRNPSQLRTASFIFDEFNESIKNSVPIASDAGQSLNSVVVSEVVPPQMKELMYSLLTQPQFGELELADERLKLISVGLPAGFSKRLSDRISREDINKESFFEKQSDVIKINVYKRDARFDDIVFKPKSYIFDLSLFQTTSGMLTSEPRRRENYSRVARRVSLTDYENLLNKQQITIDSIEQDDRYSFLTLRQKQEMLANHLQSSLLELYINYLTGLKVNEKSFLVNDVTPGTQLNASLEALVRRYIIEVFGEEVPDRPVAELLNDVELDDDVKDILRLSTFGSILFEPPLLRQKTVGAKLFDRVFHLPLRVENFEVDQELTNSTISGKLALLQNVVQNRIVETRDGRLVFRPSDENEVIFTDFFVTVETDF